MVYKLVILDYLNFFLMYPVLKISTHPPAQQKSNSQKAGIVRAEHDSGGCKLHNDGKKYKGSMGTGKVLSILSFESIDLKFLKI